MANKSGASLKNYRNGELGTCGQQLVTIYLQSSYLSGTKMKNYMRISFYLNDRPVSVTIANKITLHVLFYLRSNSNVGDMEAKVKSKGNISVNPANQSGTKLVVLYAKPIPNATLNRTSFQFKYSTSGAVGSCP